MSEGKEVSVLVNAIEPLLRAMIDEPEFLEVRTHMTDFKTVIIYITANKSDVGKIIGKQGKHADALRTLLASIGTKLAVRTLVEINPH